MPQIILKQGVGDYTGTHDTMLRESGPDTNHGGDTSLSVDGHDRGGDSQVLLRFDSLFGPGGQVPQGARITEAVLTLQTNDRGTGAQLHRLLIPWSDETATWSSLEDGIQTDGTEAVAAPDLVTDRQGTLGASTFDVTQSLQTWASGAENHGWVFRPLGENGWDFFSSESDAAPILTITYTFDLEAPAANMAPVATDDAAATHQSAPVTLQVLGNDTDSDGGTLTVSSVAIDPAHGIAVINSDNTITYTPGPGFSGTSRFDYTISDGQGGTDTATVVIEVGAVSPPPLPPSDTPFSGTVTAKTETPSVAGSGGDYADDPAIWVNRADPSRSAVIGTDKNGNVGGLYVYDLQGKVINHFVNGSAMNNVDVRYDFDLGGRSVDLVGASNISKETLDFFTIDPATHQLTPVGSVSSGLKIYGFTMSRSPDGTYHAYVTEQDGTLRQFELDGTSGTVTGQTVRTIEVGSQSEGMVADDETGALYVSEENVGIWKYDVNPATGSTRTQVDRVGSGHLAADVEGLSIYYGPNGTGYLIASSQGDHRYAVYDRGDSNFYLGSFKIGASTDIDEVTQTDGLDVTNVGLNPLYPRGMLVVHDHRNPGTDGTNYKYVAWDDVAALGGLMTDTTHKPWDLLL